MRKQQTEVVWGGVRTSLSHHAPPHPQKEGAMIAPWGSSWKRLETKGGLLILLTLPFSTGSFKRQGKAAGSTPAFQHLGRHCHWEARLGEVTAPSVEGSSHGEIPRAVSSRGAPGPMLVFSQTFSKEARLPTRVCPILRVRVGRSPQWEQSGDKLCPTLGLSMKRAAQVSTPT